MDQAVALVQAYLRVNGFLTVTEYPIIHSRQDGRFREVTDIDVLAVRFEEAGRVLPRAHPEKAHKMDTDPALGIRWGRREFLIAEVKEGEADLNGAMFRFEVIREAVRRFGFVARKDMGNVVRRLADTGEATVDGDARIRLVGFGSKPPDPRNRHPFTYIPMDNVARFLQEYVDAHWKVQEEVPFRDPVLRFLAILGKAERSGR